MFLLGDTILPLVGLGCKQSIELDSFLSLIGSWSCATWKCEQASGVTVGCVYMTAMQSMHYTFQQLP